MIQSLIKNCFNNVDGLKNRVKVRIRWYGDLFGVIEKPVLELCKQAGGIENAFAAAFGPKAGEFFGDVVYNSEFSRRRFLKNLAVGAALVTLTNCAPQQSEEPPAETSEAPVGADNLEKKDLRIGFIPITCATPIIMSEPLGFYKKYGFNSRNRSHA